MTHDRTSDQLIFRAIAVIKSMPGLRLGRDKTDEKDGCGAILRVTLSGSCAEKRREEKTPTDESKSSDGGHLGGGRLSDYGT